MEKIKIRMLESCKGSEIGTITKLYEEGQEYEISKSLASVFVDEMNIANPVVPTPAKKKKVAAVKVEVIETPEDGLTLENSAPKEWIGWSVRNIKTRKIVQIVDRDRSTLIMSNDARIWFKNLREEWVRVS